MAKNLVAPLLALTFLPAPPVVTAAPATQPAVPPLVVGSPPPASFVVEGCQRFSKDAGLGFRVAADGETQFCAVYDAADGTPLFLSDGTQTLVYDLGNDRVVRVSSSRGSRELIGAN